MGRAITKSMYMDWETPQEFFDKYNDQFGFSLDVCALPDTAKCKKYFTPDQDGLLKEWGPSEVVWMNPPYGREIGKWVRKAWESWLLGTTVVMLLPVRTDTGWWQDYCMQGKIEFIRGRLRFRGKNSKGEYVNERATFSSAVVIFEGK